MKRVITLILFLFPLFLAAQADKKIKQRFFAGDSVPQKINDFKDSVARADSLKRDEEAQRNIENIVAIQNENKARQKRAAFTRIGIGLSFLALLIMGLLRRRKLQKR